MSELHYLAELGLLDAIRTLLPSNQERLKNVLNRSDKFGRTPIEVAHDPSIRQYLARAWPINAPGRLHALAAADLADEVAEAVAAGADVNAPWGADRRPPLHSAAATGASAAAEALIVAGADVTARDALDFTALESAADSKVRFVISNAWPINTPEILHVLASGGCKERLKELLDSGVDPMTESGGSSALHWAVALHQADAAKLLLDAGALPWALDGDDLTPLDLALGGSRVCQLLARAWPQDHPCRLHALVKADLADEVVEAVAAGADINAPWGARGDAPLHRAAAEGHISVVEHLLEAGADPRARNFEGNLPYDLAEVPYIKQILSVCAQTGA